MPLVEEFYITENWLIVDLLILIPEPKNKNQRTRALHERKCACSEVCPKFNVCEWEKKNKRSPP